MNDYKAILYKGKNGNVEVLLDSQGDAWLNTKQIATLFGRERGGITKRLNASLDKWDQCDEKAKSVVSQIRQKAHLVISA